ncbi:putative Flp pilus-assembly TadE/G [Frankia torreyi]|uniref:Putative Flp pilus-assembly TadE/G n=2 Tax=Frankiaceae TaxID=74712 RepID=A0A0D8B8E6_9ACTN|nr:MULTISPECIES: pilus assembly protein TadG-related protein [Frankia]KJE20456.1 putative Flp pilus-assembly TadE/G [Frankia torreyi]KQM02987.1 putative Flp pilus-assembly TadE/G [Frankia sp. CpI1-P]
MGRPAIPDGEKHMPGDLRRNPATGDGAATGDQAGPGGADGGTILILTLGYLMVAAMLVVVVTDVSAVYLARRSVASAADGAALAAAQRIDENAIYTATDAFQELPLADINATVEQYQRQSDPSGRTTLTSSLVDATTVEVEGSRLVDLPVVGYLGVGPVTVRAGAQAQSVVRQPAAP